MYLYETLMNSDTKAFKGFFIILILLVIDFGYYHLKCKDNPSYYMDDMCFDTDYRCEIECSNFDLNYTGNIVDGCKCDCKEGYVSYCSGFYMEYEKE